MWGKHIRNPNAPGIGANVTVYATRRLKDIRTIMNALKDKRFRTKKFMIRA
jgi:hypothetical protein